MLTTPTTPEHTAARKDSHLDLVLAGTGAARVTTGFEAVRFEHCALPELDLDTINLGVTFLHKRLRAPFLIGAMTGGPARAESINRHLAEAAQELGIAMGVGSQRVALEGGGSRGLDRRLRETAPDVLLLSNLGAAQLLAPGGITMALRAVDALAADALVIHLNPLQEALQPEGDRSWTGVREALEELVRQAPVPVIAKEIGGGISARVARQLVELGIAAIEVAGAGGTSWAAIEAARAQTETQRAIASAFADWGIPTAQAITEVRSAFPTLPLIGSGGIRTGVEAAKALRLGADIVAQAGSVLATALDSTAAIIAQYRVQIEQLRTVCFCTGSADLAALRRAPLLAPWPGAQIER